MNYEILASSNDWKNMIESSVQCALGSKLNGNFIAVNYPAGFNCAIKQQYYNSDTLDTLNFLLKETNDFFSLSNSYYSLYNSVIKNIQYCFSENDKDIIAKEEREQAALFFTIVDAYKNSGLDGNTPIESPSFMYITNKIKEVTGTSYLNVNTKIHPDLATLCYKLNTYAKLAYNTKMLTDQWNAANERLSAIQNNLTSPNENNGGLNIGNGTFVPGWCNLPESDSLLKSLKSNTNISLTVTCDNFFETISNLHFQSAITRRVPFDWVLNMKIDQDEDYDIVNKSKKESTFSATITYNGITMISATPTELSDDKQTGWYDEAILKEAARKSFNGETGYKLCGSELDPIAIWGRNGQLRRLKTFVISQQPIIHLTFNKFQSKELQKTFSQNILDSFNMFGGLIQGSYDNYQLSNYHYDSNKDIIEVDIVPEQIGASGSMSSQIAFILGGIADYQE